MDRLYMISDHLNYIYLKENVNSSISKLKQKSNEISDAASSGNIIRLYQFFSKMEDISIPEIRSLSNKNMRNELKESEKYINSRLTTIPETIKQILILAYASLKNIKNNTNDPDIQSKIFFSIDKLEERISNLKSVKIKDGGIPMVTFATMLSTFVKESSYLATLLKTGGNTEIPSAIFLMLTGDLVKTFISAKKVGKRVIS